MHVSNHQRDPLSFNTWWQAVLLLSCLLLLMLQTSAFAAPGPAKRPLVDPAWVKARLGQPKVLLLDASAPPLYAKGHIPSAINASILSMGMQEATPERLQVRYQAWGISEDSILVIYEQAGEDGPMWAPHLFHDLYYNGFPADRLFLLDGGLERWKAEGGAVTQDVSAAPAKGNFRLAKTRDAARARLPAVLQASGEPDKTRLIEALEPDWHYGNTAFFTRGGHIPNAVMMPARDFYNADQTFKSPQEIRRMLDYLGVRQDQPVITYCGGGVAATVPYFALKFLLGRENISVFRESQVGWLQDERGLPFWTWSAPDRVRDVTWARTWGGAMMRMYRNAPVDFVDVRPAAEFQFRHPRFALNVSADKVREKLGDVQALRKLFVDAGIRPEHEAVVMAGKGLTPDAALVAFALEWAGQKKVSMLQEGIELAATKGLAMQDPAKPASPAKAAVPTASEYSQGPRSGMRVGERDAATGLYPRVLIAADAGQRAPELGAGKRIDLPFTDLLQPDGQPKSAGDIWKLLQKAGVPRYAEIVVFADDVAAATLNWQVLKLMGFQDVKVWLN